jgi:hypothetical protein
MKIDNPIISGSLIVSGSTTITGYLSASTFVGDGSGLVGVTSYTDSDTLSYINTLGVVSSSAQLSNQTIPGDLTVGGILTAQEFHTEFVSASIIYDSGSTQFGNSLDDIHNFSGSLAVNTNNLFVSGGRVGIGTSSPQVQLDVNGRVSITESVTPQIQFYESGSAYTEAMRLIRKDDKLSLTYGWNSGEEALTVTNTGNVGIGTTSPTAKLDVVGQVRASTGILFGSDTAAANALDDYEEGTFTPTLTGAGTPNYSVQYGKYTKIGNLVFVTIKIEASNITSSGNTISFNLPFNSANANDTSQRSSGLIEGDWVGMGPYVDTIRFRVNGASVQGVRDNSGSSVYLAYSNVASTIEFNTSITYLT